MSTNDAAIGKAGSLLSGQDGVGKQSSVVSIFAVWNTMMGTSLLAMPWGVERAGLVAGTLLILAMGGLCLYTTYCVLKSHQQYGSVDGEIAELSRVLLGSTAEFLAKMFSFVVLLGANIVYWILMSNFLFHSVDYVYGGITGTSPQAIFDANDSMPLSVICPKRGEITPSEVTVVSSDPKSLYHQIWTLDTTVPIFLILLIGPLLNFKSPTFFTKFNSLGTLSVGYLLLFVVVKSFSWGLHVELMDETSPSYTPWFAPSLAATSGMLALSYFIHNIIITIMRGNKHQENNGRDLSIAYGLVTMTYVTIGMLFYASFPLAKSCIQDNLLNNFANWDVLTVVARMFLFFQLVTVYPLISFMLRTQFLVAFCSSPYPSRVHVVLLNSVIVAACVLFAIFLPRIGTIIRFTGALSGLVHVFTLPCLLHLASQQREGTMSVWSILVHLAIPVIGGGNLLAQFFVSDF